MRVSRIVEMMYPHHGFLFYGNTGVAVITLGKIGYGKTQEEALASMLPWPEDKKEKRDLYLYYQGIHGFFHVMDGDLLGKDPDGIAFVHMAVAQIKKIIGE